MLEDIRQSDKWSEYIKFYNWKTTVLKSGIRYRYKKMGVFGFAKIQRPNSIKDNDLAEIERLNRINHVVLCEIEPNLNQDLSILRKFGYGQSFSPNLASRTFMINLTKTKEELAKALSTSAKYALNRAKKDGDYTRTYNPPNLQNLEEFYNLHKKTGSKRGFSTQSFNDIQTKLSVFGDECFLISTYDKEDNLMASKLCLSYKDGIWYIHGALSEKAQKSKSGYQNLWEAIVFFKEREFKFFDLEGAYDKRTPRISKPWKKFTAFKEKFGPDDIYFPLIYSKINLLNLLPNFS